MATSVFVRKQASYDAEAKVAANELVKNFEFRTHGAFGRSADAAVPRLQHPEAVDLLLLAVPARVVARICRGDRVGRAIVATDGELVCGHAVAEQVHWRP